MTRRARLAPATVALGALVLLLLLAAPAYAQERPIGDRSIVLSGPVEVKRSEAVDNVVVLEGPVKIAGTVRGNVVALGGPVSISGRVGGNVVTLSERAALTPAARVGGNLVYGAEQPAIPAGATVAGRVEGLNLDPAGPFDFATRAALWAAVSISTLVLGLALLWLAPRAADAALESARTRVGPAIGWGLALFFGIPTVAGLALVTLVGIPLGLGLLLALLPLYWIGYTAGAWLLGRLLIGPPRSRAVAFLAGLGILRALALVPVIGGLPWLVATIAGLGVLLVAVWQARAGHVQKGAAVERTPARAPGESLAT